MGSLISVSNSSRISLYEAKQPGLNQKLSVFVASTPETRAICNDPFISGFEYTQTLERACSAVLKTLKSSGKIALEERSTTVLNILRGGLNFGLRGALNQAFGFNDHCSAFISAQRARSSAKPDDWVITESDYQKLELLPKNDIVFGDVVATGTSLGYALRKLGSFAVDHKIEISSLLFFTIGGPRSHILLEEAVKDYATKFPSFKGAAVVYLEGIFPVATNATPMRVKLDGTDLIRTGGTLAPEFIASQYEKPTFPLERCTIYDAGSRAFNRHEYFQDVIEYWEQNLTFAKEGVTFEQLAKERVPELDLSKFGKQDLRALCEEHLARLHARLA